MRTLRRIVLAGLLCTYAVRVSAQSGAPDPAEWVPGSALAYAGVSDLKALAERYKKTAGYKIMGSGDLKGPMAVYNDLGKKLKQRVAALLETSPDQLELPAGPLAVYLNIPPGGDPDKDAAVGLLVGVGKEDQSAQRYAALVAKLREKARGYESLSVGAYAVDVFTGAGAAEDGAAEALFEDDEEINPFELDPEAFGKWLDKTLDKLFGLEYLPETLAMTLADGRLMASNSAEEIKRVLRIERGESLAASRDYAAIGRHFESPGPIRLLVNFPRIVELARASDDEEIGTVMKILGAESAGSLIAHADVGGDEYDAQMESLLLTRGSPAGLLRILSMKNGPIAPADSVPANACLYLCLNVDVPALLDQVENMIRQDDPAEADQFRMRLEQVPLPSGETLNARGEILDKLRAPLTVSVTFLTPYGPESARLLCSIGQRSRELVEKVVQMAPPGAVVPRDFQGTPIYDAPMGGMSVAGTTDTIFAGNRAAVEAALQRGGESLAGADAFRKSARLAPREAWLTMYVDTRPFLEGLFGIYEKREEIEPTIMFNGVNWFVLMIGQQLVSQYGDPSSDQVKQMLRLSAPAILTCSTVPEGIRLTYAQLKPESP